MADAPDLKSFSKALSLSQRSQIEGKARHQYALNKNQKNLERGNAITSTVSLIIFLIVIAVTSLASIVILFLAITM